jgi:hypothetical protein
LRGSLALVYGGVSDGGTLACGQSLVKPQGDNKCALSRLFSMNLGMGRLGRHAMALK